MQEFCRVLFDAIQQSCSQDEEFISKLYESQSESYCRCEKCHTESVKSDRFMDLSLTIKSDFDQVYNESLQKALKHYVKPERLTAPNLYFCETCNEKVEAVKGLRFSSLSDILTIQLNRFELDYETFQRKKINNWISYPFVLDMNNYMRPYEDIVVLDDTEFLQERERIMAQQPTLIRHVDGDFEDPLRRRRQNRKPSPDAKVKPAGDTIAVKDDFAPPSKRQRESDEEHLTFSERSQVRLE